MERWALTPAVPGVWVDWNNAVRQARSAEAAEEDQARAADRQRIEGLFEQAARDRSKAFELKQELDRLGLFKDYEDRFLNLLEQAG